MGRPLDEANFPSLSPAQELAVRRLIAAHEWNADDGAILRKVEEPDTVHWDEIGRFTALGDARDAAQAMQMLIPLHNEIVRLRRQVELCRAVAREFWAHEQTCPELKKRRKLPWV